MNTPGRLARRFFSTVLFVYSAIAHPFVFARDDALNVSDWLPDGYVRDGAVSYQKEIQTAIDQAGKLGSTLRFPAMIYHVDEQGWRLPSNITLDLEGAIFRLAASCHRDGALFTGQDVNHVTIRGGSVIGQNEIWKDGVNIRGVHILGQSSHIHVQGTSFRNLSSNAIGVFGSTERSIDHVVIESVSVENCCKRYPEYLSNERGEPGSVREDQGDIALYYVEHFCVNGCELKRSRSDETHVYRSRSGRVTDNLIAGAKMGGYFLEQCEDVIGTGNTILDNGSRGATIERGCRNCIFSNNIVRASGREGLWAPDCIGLVVTGNIFELNGRKPNGPETRYVWNANITINEAYREPTNSPTQDYLVSDNLIRTSDNQIAAIRVDAVANTKSIVIRGNNLVGENRKIIVEGESQEEVTLHENDGAVKP